jgi:hypothetical protein
MIDVAKFPYLTGRNGSSNLTTSGRSRLSFVPMAGLRRFGVPYALATQRRPKALTVPSTPKSKRCSISGAKKTADQLRARHRLRLLRGFHRPYHR